MRKTILLLLVLCSLQAFAQALTSDIQVNTIPVQTFNDGESSVLDMPSVSMSENGKVTIAWPQKFASGGLYTSYNRTYNENDVPAGTGQNSVYGSPPAGLDGDKYPRAAMHSSGNYMVVYMENNNSIATSPTHNSIYYQLYSANGSPVGSRVFVAYGMFPDIDIAPDGTFNIAYVLGHYYVSNNAVYVKRYAASGTPIGAPIIIDSYTNQSVGFYNTYIRSKNNNTFTVSYQKGNSSSGAPSTIKTYNGTTNTATTTVSGFVRTRNFIVKPDNKVVATSLVQINNSSGTYTYKSAVSRFAPGGTVQQQDLSSYTGNSFHLKGHTVGSNDNGDYVIAYPRFTNNVYDGIYVQQYNSSDQPVGQSYPVSTIDNMIEAVSVDVAACSFSVSWQKGDKIFYKRFKLFNPATALIEGPSHLCANSGSVFTASFPTGSSGLTSHIWQIQECDPAGNVIGNPLYTLQASGLPSSFSLPSNWNLPCYKHYRLRLMAGNASCPNTVIADKMIFINCPPVLSPVTSQTICAGEAATITITASNWPAYLYQNGQQIGVYNSNPITLSPTVTTSYSLQITDGLKKGCSDTEAFTITVNNCPRACFGVERIRYTVMENSWYGPMPVHRVCNSNVTINARCSQNASGYHVRVSKFNLLSWQFTGDLYNNWIPNTILPSEINLSTLIGSQAFVPNQVYFVNVSVGPVWHSAVAQFFRVEQCATNADGDEAASRNMPASDPSGLMAYPNPTTGKITLRFGQTGSGQVTVHSLDGKQVMEQSFVKSTEMDLDLSRYANGIYMATITVDGKSVKKKIIKK